MSAVFQLKRPAAADLPTPQQLAAAFKKPRTSPGFEPAPAKTTATASTGSTKTTTTTAPPPIALGLLHHSIPRGLYPLVYPPYRASDFFSDWPLPPAEVEAQMRRATQAFPPPLPPMVPPGADTGAAAASSDSADAAAAPGIMVPFVYPPLPVLRPDEYLSPQPLETYPVMAPLPFPPPGYMPYPLISHHAPLTPHEVFGDWLEALQQLPRVDMVLASAAGSIFDLRALAQAEGWTVAQLDRQVHQSLEVRSESEDADYRAYADYAEQVDTTDAVDPNEPRAPRTPQHPALVVVDSAEKWRYLQVQPVECIQGRTLDQSPSNTCEYTDGDIGNPQQSSPLPPPEVTKKRTRAEQLSEQLDALAAHERSHRAQAYAARKTELLARLKQLQNTRVSYSDSTITDGELSAYATRRLVQRDHELMRLKQSANYEKLKAALAFYQTSNRAYRNMSLVVTNRLQKLKNFLEYQQQVFAAAPDSDIFNLRTKESAKLYNLFVTHDYGGEIKNVFRAAAANEDNGLPGDSHPDFDAAWFDKVFVDQPVPAIVHDFMPLVTDAEFNLITGDAPQKATAKEPNSKLKVAKHPIFQSPLYDVALSGSETTMTDSGTLVVKKRPGRRAAPKSTNPEEASKQQTEAALVAKIMKLFVGPAAANADELTLDLDQIGIKTKWPVK